MFNLEIMAVPAAIALGLIPAVIADLKGHNFVVWWVFGTVLFPFTFPMSILLPTTARALQSREADRLREQRVRECPRCCNDIRRELAACPHCGCAVEPTHLAFIKATRRAGPAAPSLADRTIVDGRHEEERLADAIRIVFEGGRTPRWNTAARDLLRGVRRGDEDAALLEIAAYVQNRLTQRVDAEMCRRVIAMAREIAAEDAP